MERGASEPRETLGVAAALARLRVAALRVEAVARDEIHLPGFPGSALRGGLIAASQDLACVVDHRQCDACALEGACAVPALFAGRSVPGLESHRAFLPQPFRLSVDDGIGSLPAGSPFRFGISLFGAATAQEPLARGAIARLADRGLGRRRARFAIGSIDLVHPLAGLASRIASLRSDRLEIRLATPLRMLREGRVEAEIAFPSLIASLLRRATSLLECHEGVRLDLEPRSLVERAAQVRVLRREMRTVDRVRYSSRQGRSMNLIGVAGSLEIAGDLAPFLPLLAFGEATGAGKGTTFGLGEIALAIPARSLEGAAE